MRAGGVFENKKHYQCPNDQSKDQRYREKYFPEALRARDARILYGERLVAERKNDMDWEVPELVHERPFYYDVLECKPFLFTSVEAHVRIQIHFLTTFLRGDGNCGS